MLFIMNLDVKVVQWLGEDYYAGILYWALIKIQYCRSTPNEKPMDG